MIKSHQIDVIMLNDGISIGSIVAVNLHENHIISHFVFTVWIIIFIPYGSFQVIENTHF